MLEEKLKEAEPAEDKTAQPKEATENTDKSKNKKKKKKQSWTKQRGFEHKRKATLCLFAA